MKKTININLGGMAFVIDETAFETLHQYLEALKKKFSDETERDEIMHDIELRLAEMFGAGLKGTRVVISIEDVRQAIAVLGQPEDIAGESAEETTSNNNTSTDNKTYTTTSTATGGKRLYRDMDDAKIGGVIAGLCHYFGINDPVWLRILAVVLIPATSGSIILIYMLLLIVVPKAYTAAEKLQMKGEPVNISTIEREVKEAASKFSDSVHTANSTGFFAKLWDIFVSIFKVIGRLGAAFVILICIVLLIAVLVSFMAFYVFGTSDLASVSHMLVDKAYLITMFSWGFLLACTVPLVALMYACFKLILGTRTSVKWLKWTLLALWILGIGLLLFSGGKAMFNYKQTATKKEDKLLLMQPANNHLYVQLSDSTANGWVEAAENESNEEDEEASHFGIIINGRNLADIPMFPIGEPELELAVSDNDSFYIQKVVTSLGSDRNNALKNCDMLKYAFSQTDSVVHLSKEFQLSKQDKWRNQKLKIRLFIPEGKKVSFASNIDELPATVLADDSYDATYFAHTTWTVSNKKVKCLNCDDTTEDAATEKLEKEQDKMEEKVKKLEEKLNKLDKTEEKKDKSGEDF